MKRIKSRVLAAGAACVVGVAGFASGAAAAEPVTYQGVLNKDGRPVADGAYEVTIEVWTASSGGAEALASQVVQAPVVGGVFSVGLNSAMGDAMAGGSQRWLQISVRDPQTNESFMLSPRQRVTAAPRANLPVSITPTAPLNGVGPGGSTLGTIFRSPVNFHTVFDIMANDVADSFVIRTDSNYDGTVDLVPFWVQANGRTNITSLWARGPALFTGAAEFNHSGSPPRFTSATSPVVASFTGSHPNGAFVSLGSNGNWRAGEASDGTFELQWAFGTPRPVVKVAANSLRVFSEITVDNAITINGADLAEQFDIVATDSVEPIPGMVVSIDPGVPGGLAVSGVAYDRRVAGVISGAGGISPALHLRQPGTIADGDLPVAMSGRVYVYVDADAGGPVAAGDLLTTSATPGHAMRARDRDAMHGAVIGKAMTDLDSGRGLVLVLVNLH